MKIRFLRVLIILIMVSLTFQSFAREKSIKTAIEQQANILKSDIISIRRHLHTYPELSNREYKTAEYIATILDKIGIPYEKGIANTGIVALLKGEKPGAVVAYRTDMDALPVQEVNDIPYASRNDNVMHACGHDVHMAAALGTAMVLNKMRDKIQGTVKFIFQPAEEGPPDGEEGGASLMIKQGVLKNPDVSAIFGLHTGPEIESGTIGYSPAVAMASIDEFEVIIKGKRSHGAYPWKSVDPVVTASQIVLGWQTIISRNIDIRKPAVLSVGIFEIYGESGRFNIIPEKVRLVGTVRSHSPETREMVEKRMKHIAENIAIANYAEVEVFNYKRVGDVLINNEELVNKTLPVMKEVLGDDNVISVMPSMAGEDFADYLSEVPGFFFWLGVRNEEKGITPTALHTADLLIDEDAVITGVKLMANVLLDFLAAQPLFKINY